MSDLIDDPRIGANEPEFSVSEISGAIKRVIEGEFGHVRIRGELGRVSFPRSGHVYLDLKDDSAVISAVIWKGVVSRLSMRVEEGIEVVAKGRITTFGGQSKYQLVIEDMKPAGMGALMALLEKRKAMLAAEGLFDTARKKPIPYLPNVIGVVTSPSGAVIRDILHRLRDRFPRQVLIWPVAVQGEKCAPEVANAIRGFNALPKGGPIPRPDLLIVARGGGSVEDLWGFNEEIVARAAAASDIPLISAVGHETDTTLIDYVSDQRAPTPTAAAEIAVPVRHELMAWLADQEARLSRGLSQRLTVGGQRLRDLSRALPRPQTLTEGASQRLDLWGDRLPLALTRGVEKRRLTLTQFSGSLRPAVLARVLESDRRRVHTIAPRLNTELLRVIDRRREALLRRSDRINVTPIKAQVARQGTDLVKLSSRLDEAFVRRVSRAKEELERLNRMRESLGYKETLKRGYAVVRVDGLLATSAKVVQSGGQVDIEFADGNAVVGAPAERKAKPKKSTPEQGSLF